MRYQTLVTLFLFYFLLFSSSIKAAHVNDFVDEEAQEIPAVLFTVVSIELDEVSCEEALSVIENKGNFKLNYNRDRIPIEHKVSVHMANVPLLKPLLYILNETGSGLTITQGGQLAIIPRSRATGIITGIILDRQTTLPLSGVNVIIEGSGQGASSNRDGTFKITKIPTGVYTVEASMMGYATKKIRDVAVTDDSFTDITIELADTLLSLPAIIVTPGHFSIMGNAPIARQTLTRDELETVTFGEDIYRAITRLPGISTNDFSAKFAIRGGENEETLVLMDGMEILEPFHLKDIEGGAISIIDVEAVQGIDLLTGSFPAEYGDRMSGVFNIQTKSPSGSVNRTSMGISLMNARFFTEGTFHENKGSWLISARRGYLDIVLDIMNNISTPEPKYYDIFGKLGYNLNSRNKLYFNFLHSGDRLHMTEDDDDVDNTDYGNTYGWVTLKSFPNSRLFIQSIASIGNISHDRRGVGYDGESETINFTVYDHQNVRMIGFKQDWNFNLSDQIFLKWGIDYKNYQANFDYLNTILYNSYISPNYFYEWYDTTRTNFSPSASKLGLYLANRFRVLPLLTAELGIRYDYSSATDDRLFSPRVNMVYNPFKNTFIRAGWGYFYQNRGLHEIRIGEKETGLYPAELCRHWVGGIEHALANGINLRLEAYYKLSSDLRPDFRNWSNTIEVFPEVQYDRFRLNLEGATSKGLELYAKYDRGGKITWWTSYALSYARQDIKNLIYENTIYSAEKEWYPNRYDQRHTFYIDLNYRPSRKWHFNLCWQFHTGWPYTSSHLRTNEYGTYAEYGEFNGTRYPDYHRMDITFNRHFYFSKSRLSAFIAVINLYNRKNLRNIKYSLSQNPETNQYYLDKTYEYWFRLLPSVGISWTWDH